MRDGLIVHSEDPLNCETPVCGSMAAPLTPNEAFYVRNHFDVPSIDRAAWGLDVRGLVERRLRMGWDDIAGMPSRSVVVTLECAGNGRAALVPRTPGEQWQFGAASAAQWTGVPLAHVLERACPRTGARDVIFRGADAGTIAEGGPVIRYERSLTLEQVRTTDVLLAYAMNGEPLPPEHGFPLRAIVPGWYAMASVKWLVEIEVVDEPFSGHYQSETYYIESGRNGAVERVPLTAQRVRSLIVAPRSDATIERGAHLIAGIAWSGVAPIARVEVSCERGPWQAARLVGSPADHGWQHWEFDARLDRPGTVVVRSRATDDAGNVQPETPPWNRLGYGNNAVAPIRINVT